MDRRRKEKGERRKESISYVFQKESASVKSHLLGWKFVFQLKREKKGSVNRGRGEMK